MVAYWVPRRLPWPANPCQFPICVAFAPSGRTGRRRPVVATRNGNPAMATTKGVCGRRAAAWCRLRRRDLNGLDGAQPVKRT